MSTFGKETIAYRRKDLNPSLTGASAIKSVQFAHKASDGDTTIDLLNLTTPSAEMPTFTQASPSDIAAMRLGVAKKGLRLESSSGVLLQGLDFVITSATTITLLNPALEGQIFVGTVNGLPVSDLIVSEGKNIAGTVSLLEGESTLNIGSAFKVNVNASSQLGEIKIWNLITGQLLARNTGNATASPSADGNYEEVDSGNGYGTTIELNNPVSLDTVFAFEVGFHVYSGDVEIFNQIERQQGAIIKMAEDLAQAVGNPVTDYVTANPSEVERRAFGDLLLGHETRIDSIENPEAIELHLETGNGRGSSATKIRRFSNIRKNALGSYATYSDSATLSTSITINKKGRWMIVYGDYNSAAPISFGISVNASSLTENVNTQPYANGRRAWTSAATGLMSSVTGILNLNVGDVIRPQTSNTAGTDDDQPYFHMAYLGG